MKRLILIYKFTLKQFKDPVFAVALAISVIMWFLNSLSGNFTAVISVPIKVDGVVGVAGKDGSTEKTTNDFTIDCQVTGKGFNILYYSSFVSDIRINTAEIAVEKSATGDYVIDIQSLENKMNELLKGVTLNKIFQKRLAFKTLTYTSKVVPVELDIDIKNDGQFMQVGDIVVEPSHVTIAGNISLLDSINTIQTRFLRIENKEKNISGEVDLKTIKGITLNTDKVYYAINFQRYTEKKISKRVEIKNGGNNRYTIIPSEVEITLNIAENIFSEFNHYNFPLYVNIKDKESNSTESSYIGDNKFLINYGQLPKGVSVRSIHPQYVTILKGGTEIHKTENKESANYRKNILNFLEKNEKE